MNDTLLPDEAVDVPAMSVNTIFGSEKSYHNEHPDMVLGSKPHMLLDDAGTSPS